MIVAWNPGRANAINFVALRKRSAKLVEWTEPELLMLGLAYKINLDVFAIMQRRFDSV